MKDCEICLILPSYSNGNDVVVYESDHWRIVLDKNQQYLAKAFITARIHTESIRDLNTNQWADLHSVMRVYERTVNSAFQPSHFNWSCLMNIAAMHGLPTHVHWHCHPRYSKPVDFSGETFKDTAWYPHKDKADHFVSAVTLNDIASALRESI